jgi:hypothetical protein
MSPYRTPGNAEMPAPIRVTVVVDIWLEGKNVIVDNPPPQEHINSVVHDKLDEDFVTEEWQIDSRRVLAVDTRGKWPTKD